jgi:hypothetical protein
MMPTVRQRASLDLLTALVDMFGIIFNRYVKVNISVGEKKERYLPSLKTALTATMHSQQGLLAQTIEHFLQRCQIIVLVLVTSLARVWHCRIVQGILGQHGNKSMAVGVTGFGALDNPGHVATDAVGKRVDGMRQVCVYHPVAPQTLLGP